MLDIIKILISPTHNWYNFIVILTLLKINAISYSIFTDTPQLVQLESEQLFLIILEI